MLYVIQDVKLIVEFIGRLHLLILFMRGTFHQRVSSLGSSRVSLFIERMLVGVQGAVDEEEDLEER